MNNKTTKIILSALSMIIFNVQVSISQAKTEYHSIGEMWEDVKLQNILFKNSSIQKEIADLAFKTSKGNILNPKMPVSLTFIDNTKLQSNFIPADIFGGPSGSFKEVTFGQQYNTLLSAQPQLDLVNMSSIAQIKSSKINQKLTESQNLVNELALYENLNTVYHNYISLKNQRKILSQNIENAEKILKIVAAKYQEGIARKQDVNEAEINLISIKDKLEQLDYNIQIQEKIIALFLENETTPDINESLDKYKTVNEVDVTLSNVKTRLAALQTDMLRQDIKSIQYQYFPSLSLITSFNWQSLSNDFFLNSNSSNISYNFVGLKLGWDLPTVSRLSNLKNKQYQLLSLTLNEKHINIESESKSTQLTLEFQKAKSQYKNIETIALLKEDNYLKNVNQYQENILSLDRLLISHNDMLNSQINVIQSLANIAFVHQKIIINNIYN